MFWGGLVAEVLARLGLKHAVISPGSRSAPLTLGFATNEHIEAIPVLDERSAAFFALGLAKRTRRPVALVCTSGTAAANYLPAVIEAEASGVPLIILTADRPPEMRDCASGQTIDQQKLFGRYALWEHELALPEADGLRYLRQTVAYAYRRSLTPMRGPVHLNVPFRDPLAPVDSEGYFLPKSFNLGGFLEKLSPPQVSGTVAQFDDLEEHGKGLIVAGYTTTGDRAAYAEAVISMAHQLGWPVLADVLSPLRTHAHKDDPVVAHYDVLLRDKEWAARHRPDFVLQFGDLPTSKVLRNWLREADAETLVIDSSYRNLDSLHARSKHLRLGDDAYAEPMDNDHASLSRCAQDWLKDEHAQRERIKKSIRELEEMFEGKVPYLLSRKLPNGTPVFLASSMPVRDAEYFWSASERGYAIHANRGANGIDGTLSTALGIAHGRRPAVLVTGDLAFLHDSNGLLIAPKLRGSLTVVLINNGGGRIFENLPIAGFEPPFEEFFATPQQVDVAQLCAAHGIEHQRVGDWPSFVRLISDLPRQGVRVLEVCTDAARDVPLRRQLLGQTETNAERISEGDRPKGKNSRRRGKRGRREQTPDGAPAEKQLESNEEGTSEVVPMVEPASSGQLEAEKESPTPVRVTRRKPKERSEVPESSTETVAREKPTTSADEAPFTLVAEEPKPAVEEATAAAEPVEASAKPKKKSARKVARKAVKKATKKVAKKAVKKVATKKRPRKQTTKDVEEKKD